MDIVVPATANKMVRGHLKKLRLALANREDKDGNLI
jgi:hypothetical protein